MATKPKTTRLSSDLTKPQPTDAGDAPADTYDPLERASSADSDKAQAAADGHLTVNAVVEVDGIPGPTPPVGGGRFEAAVAYDPDGSAVDVVRNVDTGASFAAVTWEETTEYAKDVYVVLGGKPHQVTVAGTSGSTKPAAAASVGGTASDGTVTWKRLG